MTLTSDKYIVVSDTHVLTHKGFKKIENLNQSTVKLFNNVTEVKKYFEVHTYANYHNLIVNTKKVKITYEVEE